MYVYIKELNYYNQYKKGNDKFSLWLIYDHDVAEESYFQPIEHGANTQTGY